MMNTSRFLNLLVLELQAFMKNHHEKSYVPMENIRRVSGRPALDDIAANTYPKNSVLLYWLSDDWKQSSIGESRPQSSFGITIIATDAKGKKCDEVALEFKDRLCAYLQGETAIIGASRFSDIQAQGGPIRFNNDQMMNLIEITFKTTLNQGQSYLYAVEAELPDIHNQPGDFLK